MSLILLENPANSARDASITPHMPTRSTPSSKLLLSVLHNMPLHRKDKITFIRQMGTCRFRFQTKIGHNRLIQEACDTPERNKHESWTTKLINQFIATCKYSRYFLTGNSVNDVSFVLPSPSPLFVSRSRNVAHF